VSEHAAISPAATPRARQHVDRQLASAESSLSTDPAAAAEAALAALHHATRLRYTRGIALSQLRLGQAAFGQSRFGEALPHFERGLVAARRVRDCAIEARCTNGMGVCHDRLGHHDAALLCFDRFGELIDPRTDPAATTMLGVNIGHVLERAGRYAEAIERYTATLRAVGDAAAPGKPMLRLNLGVCLSLLGRQEEAALEMQAALDGFVAEGRPADAVLSMLNLGETLWELGQGPRATGLVEQARAQARQLQSAALEWRGDIILAILLNKQRRFADAVQVLHEAMPFAQRCDEEELLRLTHDTLGEAFEGQCRFAEALQHHKQAKEIELKAARQSLQHDAQVAERAGLDRARALLRGRHAARRVQPGALSNEPLPRPAVGGTRPRLSARERDVMPLLAQGMTNRAIGERLGISEFTVRYHVSSIFDKLGATKRSEAVATAMRHGLLPTEAPQRR
jgi:DNA-binding CsgD family transcriptional regulator